MDRLKGVVYKLLILFISLLFIGGERALSPFGDNIKLFINHEHPADIEVPNQHLTINFSNEEILIESTIVNFCCKNISRVRFLYQINPPTGDFSDDIWQPPKKV